MLGNIHYTLLQRPADDIRSERAQLEQLETQPVDMV